MAMAVEDIMCDQCIIAKNIPPMEYEDTCLVVPTRKIWLQKFLYAFRHHIIPALATFLANSLSKSLAPLQRISLSIPSAVVRIRLRKKTKSKAPLAIAESCLDLDETDIEKCLEEGKVEEIPERCVDCTVLHAPLGEPVADVIFVHGLHGGIDRTWTQGTWRTKNPKLNNLTPIRRHSTSDMYVPVKEETHPPPGALKRTLTKIYTTIPVKVQRKSLNNNNEDEKREGDDETDREEKEIELGDELNEENKEDNFSRCWPKDWLPKDCPGVRVLAVNYTTDKLWRPLWQKMGQRTNLPQRSKEMMEELLRLGVGSRPIVWVGHSKGGLYIKQIVINGFQADGSNREVRNLFSQTRTIMFYSVPHKGSPVADLTFPFFKRSIEVLEVRTNCEFVLNLHRSFLDVLNNFDNEKPEIFSFIDTENVPVGFTSLKFIARESADPDVGIKCEVPLDHREICKPAGRDCFLYLELVKLIRRAISNKAET